MRESEEVQKSRRRRFLTYSAYLLILARCREPNQTVL